MKDLGVGVEGCRVQVFRAWGFAVERFKVSCNVEVFNSRMLTCRAWGIGFWVARNDGFQ